MICVFVQTMENDKSAEVEIKKTKANWQHGSEKFSKWKNQNYFIALTVALYKGFGVDSYIGGFLLDNLTCFIYGDKR